jgi:murein DD-endopeptidase MepM/ murein hydrolase activator NlpD
LPNAKAGVQRAIARLRPTDQTRSLTVRRIHRRAVGVTRRVVDVLVPVPTRRPKSHVAAVPRHLASHRDLAGSHHGTQNLRSRRGAAGLLRAIASLHPRFRGSSRLRLQRRLIRVRLGGERALPMGIALAVIVAGVVSVGSGVVRPVGAAQTDQSVRLAIGGQSARLDAGAGLDVTAAQDLGSYVDDGTFYKPVAVDTTVESGSSLLRHYAVKVGDTLTGIAAHFGVSMMTLWWANKLNSKDALHQGQVLVIPPVNGLVITVKDGDTLDALGATYNVEPDAIMQLNNLSDPTLVVGQVLILPGAKGAPIPTPAPAIKPATSTTSTSSSSSTTTTKVTTQPFVYTSGTWAWPVVGGGNYISQYFHYGHYGIDIAAQYGTPIVAARPGTVTFAGWWGGGGGYQVWIYQGGGIYTQYCHMSSVLAHVGQIVAKGQLIGRVGMSGNATGPHVHFAVSIGSPFTSGAYFVNPLRYY